MIDKLKEYEAIVASGEIGAGTRNEVAALLGRAANEIEAKDAEIAQIKACLNGDCNRFRLGADPCPGCHIQTNIDKIDSLKSLVKELTDALDGFRDAPCDSCMLNWCPGIEKCKETKGTVLLVAKAREVVK